MKNIFLKILLVTVLFFSCAPSVLAIEWALVPEECRGDAEISSCNLSAVEAMIRNVASIILGLSGSVTLLVFMISGVRMMVARGEAGKIKAAKDSMFKAVQGLLLIIFSGFLIRLLLNVLGNKI